MKQVDTERQAAADVIAVPELLEMILSNLEMEDLFTVQRVNKTFRDLIASSQDFRKIMWMTQDPSLADVRNEKILNPLLSKMPVVRNLHCNPGRNPFFAGDFFPNSTLPQDIIRFDAASSSSTHGSWRKTLVHASRTNLYLSIQSVYMVVHFRLPPGATIDNILNSLTLENLNKWFSTHLS